MTQDGSPKTPAEFLAILKQGREVWNQWREDNPDIRPNFVEVDFTDAKEFEETEIGRKSRNPPKDRVSLTCFNLEDANLLEAHLEGAYLVGARLKGANLGNARLEGANLNHADLSNADLSGASIVGADMRGANLQGAKVMGLKYDRRNMHGKYLGINAAECYGNADFRRDAMDQDYIDKKHQDWRDPLRALLLWIWASVDYGRSIPRVVAWSALLILCFGSLYAHWAPIAGGVCPTEAMARPGAHVEYIGADGGGANVGACNGLTPYYAAAVSFSTLGFTDVIRPTSVWGQIALMANVLAGYFVLGLLLAILANTVARRA